MTTFFARMEPSQAVIQNRPLPGLPSPLRSAGQAPRSRTKETKMQLPVTMALIHWADDKRTSRQKQALLPDDEWIHDTGRKALSDFILDLIEEGALVPDNETMEHFTADHRATARAEGLTASSVMSLNDWLLTHNSRISMGTLGGQTLVSLGTRQNAGGVIAPPGTGALCFEVLENGDEWGVVWHDVFHGEDVHHAAFHAEAAVRKVALDEIGEPESCPLTADEAVDQAGITRNGNTVRLLEPELLIIQEDGEITEIRSLTPLRINIHCETRQAKYQDNWPVRKDDPRREWPIQYSGKETHEIYTSPQPTPVFACAWSAHWLGENPASENGVQGLAFGDSKAAAELAALREVAEQGRGWYEHALMPDISNSTLPEANEAMAMVFDDEHCTLRMFTKEASR